MIINYLPGPTEALGEEGLIDRVAAAFVFNEGPSDFLDDLFDGIVRWERDWNFSNRVWPSSIWSAFLMRQIQLQVGQIQIGEVVFTGKLLWDWIAGIAAVQTIPFRARSSLQRPGVWLGLVN